MLLRFVLASGLLHNHPSTVAASVAASHRAITRPALLPLAVQLARLPTPIPPPDCAALSHSLPTTAASLLLTLATRSITTASTELPSANAAITTACTLLRSLPPSALSAQTTSGVVLHIAHLLRLTQAHNLSDLHSQLVALIPVLQDRVRDAAINDPRTSAAGAAQLAITLFALDGGIHSLKLDERPDALRALVAALAPEGPYAPDVRAELAALPTADVAVILSNVLLIADTVWAEREGRARWAVIAVISTLVHVLPRNLVLLRGDDDSDDEDGDIRVGVEDTDNGRGGSSRISTNDQDSNGLSSSVLSVPSPVSHGAPSLRAVMTRVSSSLTRIMSEESVRNVFVAAVAEGFDAVLCVCDLFNFLVMRERKLIVPLRNALAFWRGPHSHGAPHVLSSLWAHCLANAPACEAGLSSSGPSSSLSSSPSKSSSASVSQTELMSTLRPDATPILSIFAGSYAYLLYIQDVDEMLDSEWPFSSEEMRYMATVLKAYLFAALYRRQSRLHDASTEAAITMLSHEPGLLDQMIQLMSRLHAVDSQRQFTPDEDNFWEAGRGVLESDAFLNDAVEAGPQVLTQAPAEAVQGGVRRVVYGGGRARQQGVDGAGELLRVAPYLVPFTSRSKIFQRWIAQERDRASGGMAGVLPDRTFSVRRERIFEDAFRELNGLGAALRATIRVKFIDEHGLQEAGIDGGGMFKEFMQEVLKLGFSPFSYGLFKATPEGHLYPNPDAPVAVENFETQFAFLGRMLGKAVFDGIVVDIPLAKFFRLTMLGEVNYPTDLASLDPELYKNMKYLKSCAAETVEDLGLTFTAASNAFGTATEVELKRNGRNVAVTSHNRIEYMHRLAHYRMNTQIKRQCDAFLRGFFEVVPSAFIRLFSHDELQLLISGKPGRVDLDDLRRHTKYSGGYSEETPVIKWFWMAMSELDADEQAKMLQFVTSCPRAPLLGFAYLVPAFCIHRAEGHVRLPTASTCMNLLKLPEYQSLEVVRDKLRYALRSNAGFDLS